MLHLTPPSAGVRRVATQRPAAASLLLFPAPHFVGHNRRSEHVPHATRDTSFAYQQDIQTKLKPGEFADRMDDKPRRLADAPDWQTVLRLFVELGENTDRNIGLVGDMLVSLQRLLPAGTAAAGSAATAGKLSPQESKQLAVGISSMCTVLLDNITRVNNKLLTNIVWALALLPDPTKALATPAAAAAARARAVGGFGAAVITRIPKLTAEEVFHVCAGLSLLGFKPPRMLTREKQQRPADDARQQSGSSGSSSMKFGELLEKRSIKVMHYLSPKTVADAGFVMSRLVAPGDVSAAWLAEYAKISKQHLEGMQPEALIYAGYAFARHGYRPSNSWQKSYIRGLQGVAKSLAGEEFPLALFTLARWRQQQQQQGVAGVQQQGGIEEGEDAEYGGYAEAEDDFADTWSSGAGSSSSSAGGEGSGTDAPQSLIDDLLFASHSNRALRELPLSQLVVMVKSLAELQATVSPMWMQRLWPLINTKIDAAVAAESSSSSSASRAASAGGLAADLAALLAAIPRLQPVPQLPADFLEGLVGNLGLGLQQLRSRDLAACCAALQQLGHQPDAIFQRQLQAALLAAVPKAASTELPTLLQLGLAVASNSSSSSIQGLLSPDAFLDQLLQAVVTEVSRRVDLAAGAAAAAAAPGAAAAQLTQQRQQLLANAAADGLWQLPQALAACVQHLCSSSSSSQAPAAVGAVMQRYLPQLQQLYATSPAALAAVMPTDPLLVLLGFMLDMPEDQEQQLGLSSSSGSSSKQAAVSAVLQSGVYQHLPSTVAASPRGSATSVTRRNQKNLLMNFSVVDFLELLVVITDAQLQQQVPKELLDVAAEALHGAMAPKGAVYGPEGAKFMVSYDDAADLVRELAMTFNYSLPAKVKSRFKAWVGPDGEVPEELTARRKKASSSSKKASTAAVPQALPSTAVAAAPPTAAAVQAGPQGGDAMVPPAAAPAAAVVDASGVVRSSRSRVSG